MAQVNNSILALVNPHISTNNDNCNNDADDCERRLAGKLNELQAVGGCKDLNSGISNSSLPGTSVASTSVKHETPDVAVSRVYGGWRSNTTPTTASAEPFTPSPHQQISSSSWWFESSSKFVLCYQHSYAEGTAVGRNQIKVVNVRRKSTALLLSLSILFFTIILVYFFTVSSSYGCVWTAIHLRHS